MPANDVSPLKRTYYKPEESYTHIELEVFQDNNTILNQTNQTENMTINSSGNNSSMDSNMTSNISISNEPQCLNEFCCKNDTENTTDSSNSTDEDSS